MRPLFSSRNLQLLREFASTNVLAAFDFDGTLAPIVPRPEDAALRPATQQLMRELAALYPCIVVTGRGRENMRRKLLGIPLQEIVGNHGIEPWNTSPAMARAVKRWVPVLNRALRKFPGVLVEDKRFSITVHYRNARDKRAAHKAAMDIAGTLPGAKLLGGKQVVNILTETAPGKGQAVERALHVLKCDSVIYVGDEKTDEDVFAWSGGGRMLSVRVGASKSSAAEFYIRDQREIDRLLRILISLRSDRQIS
jgi:trehalose 6-phosphate phosphatase